MKILAFYKYWRYYSKDERLHADFIKAISEHPEVELKTFGVYMEDIYPELNLIPFKYGLCLDDLLKKFKPDVMLLHNKSRMFWDYNPTQSFVGNEWLPSGWHRYDIPTVVLEEDYFREVGDSWYYNGNVDLILQRHYSQSLRVGKVKKIFFPFSVDTEIFKPPKVELRKNKICFVGAKGAEYYVYRRKACEILEKEGLVDIFSNDEKIGQDYAECLQGYVSHLNGSLIYNISPAKLFEILASGSVLLTNENEDLPLLFDEGSYVTYRKDCSDLIEKSVKILTDKNYKTNLMLRGIDCIKQKHTHQIRIQQLLDILKKEFNLK